MQVGDQAEHLRHVLAVDVDVVLDDPHPDLLVLAADVGHVGPVGQEVPGLRDRDVALEPDEHVRDLDQPLDPGDAGEVAIHHEQPLLGEHPGELGQRPVQQRLLGGGLVPAGRPGHHREHAAGGGVGDRQVPQLRVGGGVIAGPRRPELRPVRRRVRHPGHRPVDRAQPQVTDLDGAVVMVLVLGVRRGQHHVPQPQQRLRAGRVPPGGQHRVRRHGERHVPGQQRQVAEQRGQDLPVAGLRHQRHQQHRPQRRRHRHRPPRRALDLPPRHRLRRHLVDHAGLPGHLIQLLLDDPEPGMVSGMPAGLHPPVAAHHRRRDRHRLAEHHQVPGADPPRPAAVSAVRSPSRSGRRSGDRRSATRPRRSPPPPAPPATRRTAAVAADGTAGYKDTRDSRDQKGVSTSSLTGSPSRKPATTGRTPPACRDRRNPAHPKAITHRNRQAGLRQPAKPLIYMALGQAVPGILGVRRPGGGGGRPRGRRNASGSG